MIGLYFHIPYCRVICPYCDFVKKRTNGDVPGTFVDALLREIETYDGPTEVSSIFFGGGTPSLLTPDDTERIFATLNANFSLASPEISIEVNPDDVTAEQLTLWRNVGVNRLSLGVQSFDDEVLKFLGRCHDRTAAHNACKLIADRFENWGLDLIFGCKPPDSWASSVQTMLDYDPPHVSTYGLTYEPNTPFWNQRNTAIDDDITLEQYRLADTTLSEYNHYEVSNFAKPGFESTHNLIYWRNEQYAGFGPGAVSYIGEQRITNTRYIDQYLSDPLADRETEDLTLDEQKIETLIQRFRTREGIHQSNYDDRFGANLIDDFGDALESLVKRGLLERTGDHYAPTMKGYELNNEIGLALIP